MLLGYSSCLLFLVLFLFSGHGIVAESMFSPTLLTLLLLSFLPFSNSTLTAASLYRV